MESAGRAPPLLLPVVPVSEGLEPELLPMLVGDPDPELLEPPEPLVLVGGARERKFGCVNYKSKRRKNSLQATLTSKLGPVA